MIKQLQTNPYIASQTHYDALNAEQKREFLESLYSLLETQKALIFSKFMESHPYFESYLMEKDLSTQNLHMLANSHYVICESLKIQQRYLPNIIFYDKSMKTETLGVLLYEPFSMAYRDTLTNQIKLHFKESLRFYICTQGFLHELTTALQLQQYCNKEELHANFIESLASFALSMRASDIHLLLQDSRAACLLRLDGILVDFLEINALLFSKISQKLKLLCQLDINEMRLPQDGHLKLQNLPHYNLSQDKSKDKKQTCDIRISFLPTLHGESIVLRVPHAHSRFLSLDTLGHSSQLLKILKQTLLAKSGLILVSGPTGSGKSTLLYNCLRFLHNGTKKIITIEDPIEQEIQGITQCQVQQDLAFDFAKALKYILRQDPDIIMIGEIRDHETLDIALRAALTGHLVLASLHSSDCCSSIARLLDLGAKSYILKATLRLIIAQRLVQTLCLACKKVEQNSLRASGCHECYGRGYGERMLLQEVCSFSESCEQDSILSCFDNAKISEAFYCGLPTLQQQATKLFKDGVIGYEESLL